MPRPRARAYSRASAASTDGGTVSGSPNGTTITLAIKRAAMARDCLWPKRVAPWTAEGVLGQVDLETARAALALDEKPNVMSKLVAAWTPGHARDEHHSARRDGSVLF
jgi:hypothetical protein